MFDVDEPISDYQKVVRGMYLNEGAQEIWLSSKLWILSNLHRGPAYFTHFRMAIS